MISVLTHLVAMFVLNVLPLRGADSIVGNSLHHGSLLYFYIFAGFLLDGESGVHKEAGSYHLMIDIEKETAQRQSQPRGP